MCCVFTTVRLLCNQLRSYIQIDALHVGGRMLTDVLVIAQSIVLLQNAFFVVKTQHNWAG